MRQESRKHPSFGLLSFSRVQSGRGKLLFGSSVKQPDTITMSVTRASECWDLHRTWYHPEGTLLAVEMTISQFAEIITSLNRGVGSPVTIRYAEGKELPDPPVIDKRQEISKDFRKSMKKLTVEAKEDVAELKREVELARYLTRDLKEKIFGLVDKIIQEVGSNVPFIEKSFQEVTESALSEAKIGLESWMVDRANQLGLHTMDVLQLTTGDDDGKGTEGA